MRIGRLVRGLLARPAPVCAALAGALAAFALGCWAWGDWRMMAFGRDFVPMAPSTAWTMLLLSSGLLLHRQGPSRATQALARLAAFATGLIGLLFVVQWLGGWELPIERWLTSTTDRVDGTPVGRISPVTAMAFIVAALALCLELPPWDRRWWCRQAAAALSLAVALLTFVVLLSYAAGMPLLYGTRTVPMSLWTAVAFVPLVIGLFATAGADTLPLSLFRTRPHLASSPQRGSMAVAPLLTFLVLAVGIGTVGYFYFMHQTAVARRSAHEMLAAITDLQVRNIVRWRDERLGDGRAIAVEVRSRRGIQQLLANPTSEPTRRETLAWFESLREHNDGLRVVLLDRQMDVRLASPEHKTYFGPIAKSHAEEALRLNRVVTSDLHRSQFSGEVHLDLAIPVGAESLSQTGDSEPGCAEAQRDGVIVIEVDPRKSLFATIQDWPTASSSAETLLVRRDGDEVLYLNELRHQKDTALRLRLPIHREDLPASAAVLGREGVVEGADYRGVPVLAALRGIPETPWHIVAKMDQDEIYAALRSQALATGAIVLVLIAAAALGMGLIGRNRDAQWLHRQLAVEREHRLILDAARAAAELGSRSKSEFLANMSHEIRTPMTAILGYLDLLSDGCAGRCAFGNNDLPQHVAVIRRNGEHLLDLINGILDLSKVEAGKTDIQRQRWSPAGLLAEVVALMRVRADEKGLQLKAEAVGPVPETVLTDPLRLRQILVNLASNAIKFTERGEMRIAVRLEEAAGRQRLRFDVSDTGIGMNAEQVARLFQPFHQGDGSVSRKYGGTGLGLAISKRLAEALGGDIEVQSEPGR